MIGEFALNSLACYMPTEQDQQDYKAEKEAADFLFEYTDITLKLIDDIAQEVEDTEKAGGTEGLISSLADFVATILRTTKRIVQDVASWMTKKIKSIVNFRKRQKKFRDAKYEQLRTIWAGLSSERKQEAITKFTAHKVDFCPSFDTYRKMCQEFSLLLDAIASATQTYISQDIQIFGQQKADGKITPQWIVELYQEKQSREALTSFGITFDENAFQYRSPFVSMPSMTLADLGYHSPDVVAIINSDYQTNCWRKLYIILNLKETFERFERQLDDKSREIKRQMDKTNRKDLVASCKSVTLSVSLAGKLTAYITQVEEALDTRRGWLIDAALKACVSQPE